MYCGGIQTQKKFSKISSNHYYYYYYYYLLFRLPNAKSSKTYKLLRLSQLVNIFKFGQNWFLNLMTYIVTLIVEHLE